MKVNRAVAILKKRKGHLERRIKQATIEGHRLTFDEAEVAALDLAIHELSKSLDHNNPFA